MTSTPDERWCIHCQRAITPTEFGTWQDADNPGYEVCDLSDDNGPSHTPCYYTRFHSSGDMAGLAELADATDPVAVVLRNDGSVDVYQPVIDWLRTPEGEAWSEQRLAHTWWQPSISDYARTTDNTNGPVHLRGIFSVKEQC